MAEDKKTKLRRMGRVNTGDLKLRKRLEECGLTGLLEIDGVLMYEELLKAAGCFEYEPLYTRIMSLISLMKNTKIVTKKDRIERGLQKARARQRK